MMNKKRLLALLLAVVMIVGMIPTVWATETEDTTPTTEATTEVTTEATTEATTETTTEASTEATTEGTTEETAAPTLYEQMMAAETADAMYTLLLADQQAAAAFTAEEVKALIAKAEALPEDDSKAELLETLAALPCMACPECGEFDGHAEDCTRGQMAIMPSGTALTSSSTTLASGEYYLESNLTLKAGNTLRIPSGTDVTIDMQKYVLTGNNSAELIKVEHGGKLTIKGVSTGGHGGYVLDGRWYWSGNADIPAGAQRYNISGAIIVNKGTGGGILVAGTCDIKYATIAGCSSSHGAAIAVSSSGVLNMSGGNVVYNIVNDAHGGAIYGEPSNSATNVGSKITLSNVTISNNTSAGIGGGISAFDLTISNSTVSNNTAATNGGGIHIRDYANCKNGGNLTITDCVINNNTAKNGGGVYISNSRKEDTIKVTISGATEIKNNIASENGGGICYGELSVIGTNAKHIVISGNVAPKHGGGIFTDNAAVVKYCTIDSNYSGIAGGGIFSSANLTINDTLITNNRAMLTETSPDGVTDKVDRGRGAGIWVQGENVKCTLTDVDISRNVCMYYGGGVQVCRGATLELVSGKISKNECILKGAGGVHVTADATFIMTGGEISENIARSVGGAIHSSYTCKLYLNGGSIINNIVYGRGGGVHVNTGGNLVLSGTYIGGNKAYNGVNLISATVNDDLMTWSNVQSAGAIAGYGGGVHIDSGTCTLQGSTVSGNYAQSRGGGICLVMLNSAGASTFDKFNQNRVVSMTINSGSITGNTTDGNGGGIYLMKNMLSTEELTAAGKSEQVDAGYFLEGTPTLKITGGSVTNNTAAVNGGGAYQEGSTLFIMEGGALSNNKAVNGAGVYIGKKERATSPDGNAEIKGGTIKANIASGNGGGVMVNEGNMTMSGGTMTENTATSGNGGAVYVAGNVTIQHGELTKNKALNGGAVYMAGANTPTFIMESGTMTQNEAIGVSGNNDTGNGGAVCAENGNMYFGLVNCTGENIELHTAKATGRHHPVITSNTATNCGGGIALVGSGNITMYCSEADNNTAINRGRGLNVYMNNGNFHYHEGANVGKPDAPELVIIGGEVFDYSDGLDTSQKIALTYHHCNDANCIHTGDLETKNAFATKDTYINLPDGEYYWKAADGYRFFGWTFYGPNAENAPDYVRSTEHYKAMGDPIKVEDSIDGIRGDTKILMYALWAPIKNNISYGFAINDQYVGELDTSNAKSYNMPEVQGATIKLTSPVKAGYIFKGWYIYQDLGQNANWGHEPVGKNGSPTANKSDLDFSKIEFRAVTGSEYDLKVAQWSFGNITLIAKFEPAYTTLEISKNGWRPIDEDQSFIFNIKGQPDNLNLPEVDMNVTVNGNGTITIEHLPVGTYTITEITNWSWRYTPGNAEVEVEAKDPETVYEENFTNSRTKIKWLSGDSIAINLWGSKGVARKK